MAKAKIGMSDLLIVGVFFFFFKWVIKWFESGLTKVVPDLKWFCKVANGHFAFCKVVSLTCVSEPRCLQSTMH